MTKQNITNETVLKDYAEQDYQALVEHLKPLIPEISEKTQSDLKKIVTASIYAKEQIVKNPRIYTEWLEKKERAFQDKLSELQLFSCEANEEAAKQYLRDVRHYCLSQIILNDVVSELDVETILDQISLVADRLIHSALACATDIIGRKQGVPINSQGDKQDLMIIGMGKLGGGELNFSSDIDLIYVYAEDGELPTKGLSYREFYIHVARLFGKLLNDLTQQGFVYRVDVRLRPWGDSGPLVLNLTGLENYYQLHGRDWERYALVKSRVITGSKADKESLKEVIKPFVFRKYHDYNVFSGLGALKQQIDLEAQKNKQYLNIKLGSGGIREVEFCIQAVQILFGGRNAHLQNPSILKAFMHTKEEQFYSEEEIGNLKESYLFLRKVENRIQMLQDRQTHQVPTSDEMKARLVASLQYSTYEEFLSDLEQAQLKVHVIFRQLFLEQYNADQSPDFSCYSKEQWHDYIANQGLEPSSEIIELAHKFFTHRTVMSMSAKGLQRVNCLYEKLLKCLAARIYGVQLLSKINDLLLVIAKRSVYLELMVLHQPMLEKLVDLFEQSAWLANELISYPILLESVFLAETESVFEQQELKLLLTIKLSQVAGDVEMELDVMRVFKRHITFQIAVKELSGEITALESAHFLSNLADVMLQASFELSWNQLIKLHGEPYYEIENKRFLATMAIIAYGKLGGKELHYTSDLDVIFLHDSQGSKQLTTGEKSIDNVEFFSRLAKKIIATISLLTSSGRLYEIDARLRPNGASGFLVTSFKAYETYQYEKAWVWEHQALVRAQWVAGNSKSYQFDKIKCDVLSKQSQKPELKYEVSKMRDTMYRTKKPKGETAGLFDVKHSRGGMVDIEFIVQYLVLLNANKLSSLCQYSDNITLIEHLIVHKKIDGSFKPLIEVYRRYHQLLHGSVLKQQKIEQTEQIANDISTVLHFWEHCFKNSE